MFNLFNFLQDDVSVVCLSLVEVLKLTSDVRKIVLRILNTQYFMLNFNTNNNKQYADEHEPTCTMNTSCAFPRNNKINISNIESGYVQRFGGIAKSFEFFKLLLPPPPDISVVYAIVR